ncbi:hypothetical protein [Sphingobacterium sp. BS-2]|uniref:hypothetical protein n=1 Tax=Sphingobacterium sp. BS-2 TaxID=3377129 RepID=UPI0038FBF278
MKNKYIGDWHSAYNPGPNIRTLSGISAPMMIPEGNPGSKFTPNSAFHLSKIQKNGIMVDLNKEIGVY